MRMRIGLTFERKSDFTPPPGAPPDAAAEMEMDYTIDELAEAIESHGHACVPIGNARRLLAGLDRWTKEVDLVFNYSVGYGGRSRETWVPALLDVAGVPYVGGDAVCLGIATDKQATKALARSLGVRAPEGVLLHPGDALPRDLPPFPLLVKPAYEGSSIGMGEDALVEDRASLERVVRRVHQTYRQAVVAEEFIEGREATVCLVGDPLEAFGTVGFRIDGERELGRRFLHNALKGDPARTAGDVPSGLPPATEEEMERGAVRLARALGARDFCRCDFRIREGTPYLLEANPIPQLQRIRGEFSLVAESKGQTFHHVVGMILGSALRRHGLTPRA